jgi:hypothetical protein
VIACAVLAKRPVSGRNNGSHGKYQFVLLRNFAINKKIIKLYNVHAIESVTRMCLMRKSGGTLF